MKKYFLIILICTISFPAFSQGGTKLYKNLIEGMPIKEARKTVKKNKADYGEVSFGGGFIWVIKTTGLMRLNDKLLGIWMWPKGSFMTGVGYDSARNYLDTAGAFFEKRGYTELIKNQWWNAPQNFNSGGYLYGYVLLSPEKDRVVHIYPSEVTMDGSSFNPQAYIKIFSKTQCDKMIDKRAELESKDTENTDF